MKFGIWLTAFLFVTINSCQSSKAIDFKESLEESQRRASEIILGKEGPGEKKLKCLQKDDYKGALRALELENKEFNRLITHIKKLSTEGIPEGKPLKTAALEYYESLKELHVFDRKEIEQQALLRTLKNNQLNNAQNNILALAKQKKMLYATVYQKEALLRTAIGDFETANGF
ncbi:hypothetical protein [Flavobacterium sp. CSZ]|uniref:hypothetical protein n=1 Tax=Flavobacterium sp. CSZ TaxID=2783791 RepID=UPI00188CA2FE|nr:hypothetical protein [Flavobacterium sp. CSZ]MBF4486343.1 hypothetical protein [Flavobacterium sp. CSZ]